MWLIWDTKVLEFPLYKKLVGMKHMGKRPSKVVLSRDEWDQLAQDGEKGTRYARFLECITCRTS